MELLMNNPLLMIAVIQSILIVMLVAALIIRAERAEGSVPQEIALKLASMIPQEYLLQGANWIDKQVKSDANPANDWIGDASKAGANAVIDATQAGEPPVL